MMREMNCTFSKVEMLPHNVGYVKLDAFPQTAVCEATAQSVMAQVNGASVLILDLRDNGGGFQDMVNLIAGYLICGGLRLCTARVETEALRIRWRGTGLADKPVYVLGRRTRPSRLRRTLLLQPEDAEACHLCGRNDAGRGAACGYVLSH